MMLTSLPGVLGDRGGAMKNVALAMCLAMIAVTVAAADDAAVKRNKGQSVGGRWNLDSQFSVGGSMRSDGTKLLTRIS